MRTLPDWIKKQWPNAVDARIDGEVLAITEHLPVTVQRLDYRGLPLGAHGEYNPLNGIPIDR